MPARDRKTIDTEKFVRESNLIEGIRRTPLDREVRTAEIFLGKAAIEVADMEAAVAGFEPGQQLRNKPHMNVRVGGHVAPQGGPQIEDELRQILAVAHYGSPHPYYVHREFERLHPFTDGNGRTGRLLWLWQMLRLHREEARAIDELGFLHCWYYQSLEFGWATSDSFF